MYSLYVFYDISEIDIYQKKTAKSKVNTKTSSSTICDRGKTKQEYCFIYTDDDTKIHVIYLNCGSKYNIQCLQKYIKDEFPCCKNKWNRSRKVTKLYDL